MGVVRLVAEANHSSETPRISEPRGLEMRSVVEKVRTWGMGSKGGEGGEG